MNRDRIALLVIALLVHSVGVFSPNWPAHFAEIIFLQYVISVSPIQISLICTF